MKKDDKSKDSKGAYVCKPERIVIMLEQENEDVCEYMRSMADTRGAADMRDVADMQSAEAMRSATDIKKEVCLYIKNDGRYEYVKGQNGKRNGNGGNNENNEKHRFVDMVWGDVVTSQGDEHCVMTDAEWKTAVLVTDNPDIAQKAAAQGVAAVGYIAPDREDIYFPGVRYVVKGLCGANDVSYDGNGVNADVNDGIGGDNGSFNGGAVVDEEYFDMVYMRTHGIPATIAYTERTVIREMTENDLPALYGLYDDDEIKKWVEPLYEYEEELEFTRAYIDNMYGFYGYGLWLVFDREKGKLIGRAGISNRVIDGTQCQELGYMIAEDMRRRGIGYEVCAAILGYAEDVLGLKELYICTERDNEASVRLAAKLGFKLFGTDAADCGMEIYRIDL